MSGQKGFCDVEDRLAELSAEGDPLERLSATVDFDLFRPVLVMALQRDKSPRLGRPPFCPVLKFKMLVLQSLHGLSVERTAYMVWDRLSWMRFCGLDAGGSVPDANTLWDFRETLIKSKALDKLFARLNDTITQAGYLPMGGQIIDASLIAAPRQRNTQEEKQAIKQGKTSDEIWPDEPAKARQKDVSARLTWFVNKPLSAEGWTLKQGKAPLPDAEGKVLPAIAIPFFGYKDHISIDRRYGFIRRSITTDVAAHEGPRLREGLIDPDNTASDGWADTAYCSAKNEDYLLTAGKVSRIHNKKSKSKPMTEATRRSNGQKSKVRARVEHVFAELKSRVGLFVRTIGMARAEATITLANMVYNMKRWFFLNSRTPSATG